MRRKASIVPARFTAAEWDAIYDALAFIEAGQDPWESDAPDDGESPTMTAVRSALDKLRGVWP